MAIGGDARAGLIVYETTDDESFNNLVTSRIITRVKLHWWQADNRDMIRVT